MGEMGDAERERQERVGNPIVRGDSVKIAKDTIMTAGWMRY